MQTAYRLKITLKRTHPPIWRRVLAPERFTLLQLCVLIQRAMGWEDKHWHEFIQQRGPTARCFMLPEVLEAFDRPDDDDEALDALDEIDDEDPVPFDREQANRAIAAVDWDDPDPGRDT
jgi:hypothetical protein